MTFFQKKKKNELKNLCNRISEKLELFEKLKIRIQKRDEIVQEYDKCKEAVYYYENKSSPTTNTSEKLKRAKEKLEQYKNLYQNENVNLTIDLSNSIQTCKGTLKTEYKQVFF